MKCTIGLTERQWRWGMTAHKIAIWGLVALTVMGARLESVEGWEALELPGIGWRKAGRERSRLWGVFTGRMGRYWLRQSWKVAALRSGVLVALVLLTRQREWKWVCLLPWVAWLWKGIGIMWPLVGQQPLYVRLGWVWDRGTSIALIGLGLTWMREQAATGEQCRLGGVAVGMCSRESEEPYVQVERDAGGVYHVRLGGEFELRVDGKVEFYKRLLIVFLGLLEVPGEKRKSRRTRDGRTPFVRQEQLAECFEVQRPEISRWYDYWLRQDWRRMLSQRRGELLTLEMQQQVIDTWVKFPWRGARPIWEHLRSQGSKITLKQVQQVGRESGWVALRQALSQLYEIKPDAFSPRDGWLVGQLLTQIQGLVQELESLGGLTLEQRVEVADLETLCQDLDLPAASAHRPLPWMLRLERRLFGHWDWVEDETVRCIYCGTTDVSRKSRQPRPKKYIDQQGEEQTLEVFRYYCRNPTCQYQTFTNLPPNLIPHSKWTLEHHLTALQVYEGLHSAYRCTSHLLGVSKMTTYRWVSAFGHQLLPMAALFGLVRSSGAVGIDEKYVLVPKNDKAAGDRKRWMYVYLAVDSYTYDLLHIEIYPYNTQHSATAFLLALRAKGYQPRVVVTDMRLDYGDVIAQVFPNAVHHECIFHALQQVHRLARKAYGSNYAKTHPQVTQLLQDIDAIFTARTKRTAWRRYAKVLALRDTFVQPTPESVAIFDFLERHWPKLVNAIESRIIPTTNNSTEQVIRIFSQHYKTFCGFENIESARLYLGVFETVYRFAPFSDDAQARLRGKCPLELAGYEVQKLPIAHLFRGLALQWPAAAFQELVPNV